jgi:hypothetical protein
MAWVKTGLTSIAFCHEQLNNLSNDVGKNTQTILGDTFFLKLNILNVYDLCKTQISRFVYKTCDGLLPNCSDYFTFVRAQYC